MQKILFAFLCLIIGSIFCFVYGAELVDVNTASLTQLDSLVGIGLTLGQKIIDNRPYNSIDDLLKVQGIGPKNLEKIKQQGIACVHCQKPLTSASTENIETTNNEKQTSNNETPTTSHTTDSSVKSSPLPILSYPGNIFINEILPSPEGSDTENEFIELFNANNFSVNISGFKIKDTVGAVKTFIIPEGTTILANNFLVFKSSQTKLSLNNAGDGVELLNPKGVVVDSTDFGKSQSGQSWSKSEAGFLWTAKPTPGQENIILTIPAATSISPNLSASSSLNPFLANIQKYPPQRKNFLAVGIATAIAFLSAIIAWKIKKHSTEI